MSQAKAGNLEYDRNTRYWSVGVYRGTDAPAAFDEENYFLPLYEHVRETDEIDVITFDEDEGWWKARYEVLTRIEGHVTVQRLGEWRRAGPVQLRGLTLKWKGPVHKHVVMDENNRVVAGGLSKAEAQRLVGESAALEPAREREPA